MSADNALAALYYLASLAPAHLRPRGLRRPRKPREQTDADRAALAAAELKRARKNAKRLGLAKDPSRTDVARFWIGTVRGFLVRVHITSQIPIDGRGGLVYSWSVRSEGVTYARSDWGKFFTSADEAELAALRAVSAAVERMAAVPERDLAAGRAAIAALDVLAGRRPRVVESTR